MNVLDLINAQNQISENIKYKEMVYDYNYKREILAEGTYLNYQFYIMNYGTHPCAYIEIPITHKYFAKNYDEIDLPVNGGLTYNNTYLKLDNEKKVDGWFVGWDYAHYRDFYGHSLNPAFKGMDLLSKDGKKWTTIEILQEVIDAIEVLYEEID